MTLKPRERLVLTGGGAAALVVMLWTFVWTPLERGAAELRDGVGEKTRLLAELRRAETLQAPAPGSAPVGAGQSLVLLVDNTARAQGVAASFTRTRPDAAGGDAISVSFQDAGFDTLLGWLVTLERDYGVSVESASFNAARDPGLVNGQVFLRRF